MIGAIAVHRVCQPTPSLRAGPATDPSTAASLPAACTSRNTTRRRPLDRALTPQSAQNTVCPPGDPRLHHQLAGLETLSDNRQTEHAETRNRTSHNHQRPPDSWTI